jgi:hypothetical protein
MGDKDMILRNVSRSLNYMALQPRGLQFSVTIARAFKSNKNKTYLTRILCQFKCYPHKNVLQATEFYSLFVDFKLRNVNRATLTVEVHREILTTEL